MNIEREWKEVYKPKILENKRVPLELAAEILGYSGTGPIMMMCRSPDFSFCSARREDNGKYRYEIYPLRFIAWYEGRMQ